MDSAQEPANQEAARWYARLRAPDCTAVERAAFEKWLASDPRNQAAFANAERMTDALSKLAMADARLKAMVDQAASAGATLPEDEDEEEGRSNKPTLKISAVPASVGPRRRIARPFAWAASIGATALAGLTLLTFDRATPGSAAAGSEQPANQASLRYTTSSARRAATLEDGTRVYLDVASELDVHFDATQRAVTLQQGRVLFDSAYDASRPFVVSVDAKSVTALGTMFQVERAPAEVVVTLLHGTATVASQSGMAPVTVSPGEELRSSGDSARWLKRAVDAEAAIAWSAEGRAKHVRPPGKLAFESDADTLEGKQF
jgi:transmembrane sensor